MASRPNVIFILTDDQGTLDVNCYGARHLHTPNMDRLAREGVRFTRAYGHTVCCPSRANLLTGRHAQRVGINDWTQNRADGERGINVHADEETAAAAFKRCGYRTGLFGKWHLGAARGNRPLDMGFDEFFGHLGGFIENYTHYFLHGNGFHDLWDGDREVDRRGDYFPRMMNERALAFIEQNKACPFFLVLAYNLPHYPEQSEEKYASHYGGVDERVKTYGMTVSTVDGLIGEVLDRLDALGLADNTIVTFMSDNGHSSETCRLSANHASGLPAGWYYGAHGAGYAGPYKGGKTELTEGGIRVPCMLRAPGRVPPGIVSDAVVCGLDWLPTVLALCGLNHRPVRPYDGLDLSQVLTSGEDPDATRTLHFQWQHQWAVLQGDWKLIGNDTDGQRRLVNVADENPEAADYLQKRWVQDKHRLRARAMEQEHVHWLEEVREGYQTKSLRAGERE